MLGHHLAAAQCDVAHLLADGRSLVSLKLRERCGAMLAAILGVAAQSGFLTAEAREARHAAQRRRDPGVEAQDLACAQKKARCEGRTIVFIDESGLSEKCPVTRTWAPRGQTPVIQQSFTWKQMSAITGLSWWRFCFRFFDGAIRGEQVIEFLGG